MVKKKKDVVEIIFPQELKKYRTSDYMEFESFKAAEEHEEDLKNPYYIMYKDKCKELQNIKEQLQRKEQEIELLNKRVEDLQKDLIRGPDRFPTQLPQDPWKQPCPTFPTVNPADPSQQPYRWDSVELAKLSDEELLKRGYNVTYCGSKRSIIPQIRDFDFNGTK